jgi:hypothetical protein
MAKARLTPGPTQCCGRNLGQIYCYVKSRRMRSINLGTSIVVR